MDAVQVYAPMALYMLPLSSTVISLINLLTLFHLKPGNPELGRNDVQY